MNDLNPVQLSPTKSNNYNKGTIFITKNTFTKALPDTKEEIETINDHQSQKDHKNVLSWGEVEKASRTNELEGKISSGRPVKESGGIVEAQNISPDLYDSVDATLNQADYRMTESKITFQDTGNSQQGVSRRLSELSVSEVSNTTKEGASNTRQYSKVRRTEEVDEGRLSQRSSTSSDKSLSNNSLHNSPTLQCNSVENQRDDSNNIEGEHVDADTKNMDGRHQITELHVFEVEEQRRRDAQDFQTEADNFHKDASFAKTSRSVGSER